MQSFKTAYTYDIEVYRNLFMICLYERITGKYVTFSYFSTLNFDDRENLFHMIKGKTLIGYNSKHYDSIMLEYIRVNIFATTEDIWNFSNILIKHSRDERYREEIRKYKYTKWFNSWDISELVRIGAFPKTLKLIGCNLKHDKLQDLPIPFDKTVTIEDYQTLFHYNRNDVVITEKLIASLTPELEMRELLSQIHKLPLHCESNTNIAVKLLTKWYSERSGDTEFLKGRTTRGEIKFADIIFDYIHFDTSMMADFLVYLKTVTLPSVHSEMEREWKFKLMIGDLEVSLGLGGIHSVDSSLIIKETDEMCILDLDVASQYPTVIVKNRICPEHLDPDIFIPLYLEILTERLKNKRLFAETLQTAYNVLQAGGKISANSVYGLLLSPYHFLFDPQCSYTVVLNNQLMMLMLIERLQAVDIKVLSANTDGVTLWIAKQRLDEIRLLCREWEKVTQFELEENFYRSYVRKDVNNYLAVTHKGKVKAKGCFLLQDEKDLTKGFKYPIVAIALRRFYMDGIPYEQTIRNHTDIYDFCACQKVDAKFTNYLFLIENKYKVKTAKGRVLKKPQVESSNVREPETLQSSVRWYVSRPSAIYPMYNDDGTYLHIKKVGFVLKKGKLTAGKRYEVVKIDNPDKLKDAKGKVGKYAVHDVVDNNRVGDDMYSTLVDANKYCKSLNAINKEKGGKTPSSYSYIDYAAEHFVTVFNDFHACSSFKDYLIDYSFYIDMVETIVSKIKE